MKTFGGIWMLGLLGVLGGCAATEPASDDGGGGTGDAVESVVLLRQQGPWFCPSPNQFIEATLAQDDARALTLYGTVFRAYVPEVDCSVVPCLVTDSVGPLLVSDADAARLAELANELRIALAGERSRYSSCEGERDPGCDPCMISEVVIDGVSHVDDPCVESPCMLYTKRLTELERFIDGLAPPPG